jgi:hypothetical protein
VEAVLLIKADLVSPKLDFERDLELLAFCLRALALEDFSRA